MAISTDSKKLQDLLTRGVHEIIGRETLENKLASGNTLCVKLGIDPTSPNLHLGRSIPLLKLRDFQELGHKIVFIIGDFTGVIGDTSDKESERPMLAKDVVAENMRQYAKQAGKIIDLEKCEVRYNSEWLGKLTYAEIGDQADAFSVAEFIARENIRRRLDAGTRVSLREMLYPLMQGYDSVAIDADVEVGGTDQRFNLLAGRVLQEKYKKEPQAIMTNPLVAGTDGRKMSSSWGNTVNIIDAPNDMFGKIMSIPDSLIIPYFENMTRVPMDTVREYKAAIQSGANPRDYKVFLAKELVRFYYSPGAAGEAEAYFVSVFAKKEAPADMPTIAGAGKDIVNVLIDAGFASSKTDARRAIDGDGVKINDEKITSYEVILKAGDVVQKGKRFFIRIQ
ncbi:MAG TPA: tyrosine--tRNA ligase [Candidatus Magasanikbacteria bacterium]|nr:MAG: tyrosine--tRNA ligase [Candidatus Magasanikbacteria bacterium RIFCSPHIGHO2_02_FULL_48_18]OGH81956.1 MAG: tyrosine--tRNA ligase [Candidatus Magasanikbacteria bacterium RIFCSPLOWO2_12_FULL_47_9b]HAZ28819.1 tyrosine--tRNA ligase [Candidatus Magasanikbacteria bacterium]